ncbi:OmpA family protein [Flavobacteriaceae bacterium]|nr:OmpA family protein [Flavobacteriaceae bacterium]MDB9712693.1 OmpA family protein [Flavobacteriaceae bacterium]MDC1492084.1 OmpA family protein [Flavobacteriaceae bacterium]MDC1534995.1 OmpA family protein [Flavobacteriaceae bacterium]
MKNFSKLLLVLLITISYTNIQSQDNNNPWQFSFGINAVDLDADSNTQFGEFFDVDENWNVSSGLSMFTLSKYLGDNLSLGLSGSVNSISKFADGYEFVNDVTYFAGDLMLKYSLGEVLNMQKMEPFVGVGLGNTWMDSESWMTSNASLGMNYWFSDVWGLTAQVDYKLNMSENGRGATVMLDEGGSMRYSVGFAVKFGGTDTDGDGVYDKHDACPDVPGLEEFNGCPDSDGDGIQDSEDTCPLLAGSLEFEGCPDTDGDGVSDNEDACPNKAGLASLDGCPDSDGDGVTDSRDNCPNVAGPKENRGCPWPDSDGDSVLDKDDDCPSEAGSVANNGCPEIYPSDEALAQLVEYSRTINFAFDSAEFTDGTPPVLDAIVEILMAYPKANFSVEGHCDSKGSKKVNQKISDKRANAVVEYLSKSGIAASRLSAKGFGESMPIDTNDTRDGRANNRRVEIILVK